MVDTLTALTRTGAMDGKPASAAAPPAAGSLGTEGAALPAFASLLLGLYPETGVPAGATPAAPAGEGEEPPADGTLLPPLAGAPLPVMPVPLPASAPAPAGAALGQAGAALAGESSGQPLPPLAWGGAPHPGAHSPAAAAAPGPAEAPVEALAGPPPVGGPVASATRGPADAPPDLLAPEPRGLEARADPGPVVPVAVTPTGGEGGHGRPGASAAALAPQVSDPRWGEALGERLVWMVRGDAQQARLRLDPPDLGPLEVHIRVVEDEARISFAAPQSAVREAVEAALPRLREMLAASGVNLVQVDVSSQDGGHRPPAEPPAAPTSGLARAASPEHRLAGAEGRAPAALSLLDVYA
jgi:flagellar hook-length control protein FliK